ncbi:ceramide kinase-like protein [Salvelinus fontinalis]|uniref:ceramide kinase-like protein n=1 Tax=Salvelinus fontinalis TaxID=8038 RepID=UPI002485CFE8|nr:ceramide kinase-like protein [Salvelinus fontinalis]
MAYRTLLPLQFTSSWVVDVCSFSSLGRSLHFGFSAMYGFVWRTLALAERHRWMPPGQKREFAVIKKLANLKPEDCELSYLPVKKVQTETLDLVNVALSITETPSSLEEQELWMTNQGLFLNVSIMAVPCLCSMAPRGLAPNTSMALIAAGNTSRSEFIKHLKRYKDVNNQARSPGQTFRPHTHARTHARTACFAPALRGAGLTMSARTTECESKNTPIISSEGTYPWNVNGDLLEVRSELLIRYSSSS